MKLTSPLRMARPSVALLAAVLLVGLSAFPAGRSTAATGVRVGHGEPWVGMLVARPAWASSGVAACTVVAVSQYVALSAAHCGYSNVHVKLDASRFESAGQVVRVTKGIQHPTLDVEALFLARPTGLPVLERTSSIHQGTFSVWGYGMDSRNLLNLELTRADFEGMARCGEENIDTDVCWNLSDSTVNGICNGDSGGPITQDGRLIGILSGGAGPNLPDGRHDCSRVVRAYAVSIAAISAWVDQMVALGNPLP